MMRWKTAEEDAAAAGAAAAPPLPLEDAAAAAVADADPVASPDAARTCCSCASVGQNSKIFSHSCKSSTSLGELAARALARLTEAGVEILTFAQSFSERSLTLAVRGADAEFARDCLATAFDNERAAGAVREITLITPIALVAVISTSNSDNLMPRTLSVLGRAGAHVLALAQSTSSYHISFILPEAEVDTVVRMLHADLGLA